MPGGVSAQDIQGLLEGLQHPSWTRKADALRTATARLASGAFDREDEVRLGPPILQAAKDQKWEVRKAAALALAEFRHLPSDAAHQTLNELACDSNRWVSQAAARAIHRVRSRSHRAKEWALTEDTQDPTLQYIFTRIREIGLRSMTPAQIYDLAMEIAEQSYRESAADTAHEIRTLLTPLEGYMAELGRHLAACGAVDATAEHYLTTAFARLQQIQLLVENLQIYSSPANADFAPVDLASLVREAVAIGSEQVLQDAKPPAVKQDIDTPEGLIIDALRERLIRAITNLVANAYQAMSEGGTLTVRAKLVGTDFVELTVSDTGQGMSAEMIEQARERFRTTRRDEGGTGLGLPIAERIIEHDHRGEMSIDSAPGQGTRVIVTLPVRRELE